MIRQQLLVFIAIGVIAGLAIGIAISPYTGLTPTQTITIPITMPVTYTHTYTYTVTQTLAETRTTTIVVNKTVTTTTTIIYTATSTPTVSQTTIDQGVDMTTQQRLFEFVLPWNDNVSSSIDLSSYLHKPAGRYGHVYVGSDGRLYVGNQRIRFLGVNLVATSAFSPPSVVDQLVQRLAKYGVNLVRLHALDAHWTSRNIFRIGSTRELDTERLERLDYLIYKLKESGIYVNINLLCYRPFSSADGLPREVDGMPTKDKHLLPFFNDFARELVKEFAYKLLTRVNKYTGLRYADDPAIAFIEILNEYGMIFGWLDGAVDRLPEIFKIELQNKWNEHLRQKYALTDNLRREWGQLHEDEDLEKGTVRIFTLSEYRNRPTVAQRDWVEFLWKLEYDFFKDMHRFLKEEIGVKSLVIGTQVVFGGTPNIQQLLDVVDTHHYWRYPEGSGSDFYVVNDAMVNSPTGNTIVSIAYRRVYGRPFTVSEYNHPAPNVYRAEAIVFLPAYAAFHDWDAIIFYCYGDPGGSPAFGSRRMRSTLDIDQDPARWALMITAHMLFIRGDVRQARHWVIAELPKEVEIELVRSRRASVWNLPHGTMVAPPYIPLIHGVGLVTTNGTRPPHAITQEDVLPPAGDIYVSDTSELIWDCREPSRCLFIVNTSRSKVVSGFIGGRKIDLGDVIIDVKDTLLDGWATIALHVLEGSSFKDAKRILVVTVGAVFNSDMPIYEYTQRRLLVQANTNMTQLPDMYGFKVTTFGNWGKAPTIAEGIEANIMIKNEKDLIAYSLDPVGLSIEKISVDSVGEYKAVSIRGSYYRTIWYELNVNHTTP